MKAARPRWSGSWNSALIFHHLHIFHFPLFLLFSPHIVLWAREHGTSKAPYAPFAFSRTACFFLPSHFWKGKDWADHTGERNWYQHALSSLFYYEIAGWGQAGSMSNGKEVISLLLHPQASKEDKGRIQVWFVFRWAVATDRHRWQNTLPSNSLIVFDLLITIWLRSLSTFIVEMCVILWTEIKIWLFTVQSQSWNLELQPLWGRNILFTMCLVWHHLCPVVRNKPQKILENWKSLWNSDKK